jgi:hypothetical protein
MDKSAIIKALRDGTQAASNGIANSVVGQPVDWISDGLRYAGVNVPQNAVGGTEWLAQKGLTRPVEEGAPQVIGDAIGQTMGNMAFMPTQVGGMIKQAIK